VSGDFDILNGNPSTLASLAGRSIQVTGNAALTGLPAQHLNLAPGAAWTLTVSGLLHVSNADIRNSLAAASAGYADSSLNLGGNVNWIFMDTVKPGNVTGFAATALGGHSITLAWSPSASSDADSVMLRYRTDGIFPTGPADGTLWRSVPKNLTADTATALTDKTIYHFAAFARDSSGNYSLAASAANDTALLPDVTPPANVTAFNAAASGPTTVALGWTGSVSTDADTVMIRYRTDGAFPAGPSDGTLWQVLPNSALNGTVTGLVSNTLYHFGAFVRDSSGNYGPAAVPAQDTALYQAPVLGSVAINDKSGGTADVDPALAFTYSGADSMRFSLLADTATAAWKSLRALDSVAMGGGADGKRIVAAQFKNVFGNRSAWYRDTTLMDRTAPAVNLTLNTDHSWRNWQDAVVGKALDAILGTDSVFVVRKRVADGFYFNGAGWTTVADTARLRVDSAFSVPMPNTAMATGSYDFTAIARDRIGNLSAPLTVRVNYTDNRAPVAAASGIADSVPQNQQVTWTVDLADPDAGDSVLTVASTLPAWMTMTEKADSARGGFAAHRIYTFTGKPLQADVGTATVTIQARDLGNKTFIYTKSFPVIDVNDPPVFASAGPVSAGAKEDSVTRYVPKYSDADEKDPHALAFLQAPAWAVIADSALIFKPGSRDVGTALVRVTISDGRLLDTLDINVDVANVNDAPVAFPSTNWQAQAHWKEDVADSFTVVVVDMDKGDPVAMTSVLPPWIKFTSTTDATEGFNRFFRFTVKPAQTDTGAFPFKLRFQDAAGAASELQFSAKVAAVNDTPTAFVKGVESLAGAARISFDAADEDGNAASTRFHYRLISASGDTVRRGIIASPFLRLHPLADGDYKLAVAAEDEGGLKQVGYTMANLRISGATALTLDSARWNMIGYPGRSLAAGALGAGAALTTWDESSSDGSPLGRYAAGGNADSLYGGKGYWVRVANRVNLNTPLAALLDKPFTMKLTHGKQGWNQIGNPFPYFVDLSASGLTFWEWDANRRDLVNAKGIMKPWGAYWVQVPKDTILTVKDSPYFPAGSGAGAGVLAKSSGLTAPSFRQVSDWSLQLALQAGPYQDQANFLGVRPESRDGLGISSQAVPVSGLLPDAPKFGDYIALHFERPGETTGGNADGDPTGTQSGDPEDLGFAADFREHMGEDEEWWDFSVENSQSGFRTANLSLPGLAGLQAAGLNAFLVRKGEAVPLSAETPAVVSMDGEATHYSLVVTPHADFAERLKGNFSISQNFPNPVQTHTAFRFFLPQTWDASGKREAKAYRLRLNVYDFSGRLAAQVADGSFKPGSHTLVWKPQAKNGGSLAKGAYVYRLEIPGFTKSLKMLVK
ncbi:MAG: outer rane adhesin like protein, partial [Fibrobacteres bacterium]|nr:outer rane adhesin like protein [Fibrobacterota bacterium]